MPILAIDHILLTMPPGRQADARKFYGEALGLAEIDKPEALERRGGCWFQRGSVVVHLGVEADFRPARKAHPAFLVDDFAALRAVLIAASHRVTEDAPIEGYARFFVDDPFGNRIELMQVL